MSDGESPFQSWVPGPLDSPPPSVKVDVEFCARSRRGPRRPVNDDHYLIMSMGRHHETLMTSLPESDILKRFEEFGYGMVVADGMGGAGEAASRLAISTLTQLVINFGRWHLRVDEPIAEEMIDRARRFCRSVDSTLLQTSRDGAPGLQTTLTAVYIVGIELFFAHVGHSRAYLFRDDQLMQLTRDHTVDDEHLRQGDDRGRDRRRAGSASHRDRDARGGRYGRPADRHRAPRSD